MTHAVLVVEDEVGIRESICRHLEERGLTVFRADCASHAIGMIMDDPEIALVFANFSMSGQISGRDLILWLKLNRPRIAIMISTSGPARIESIEDLPVGCTFLKPYKSKAVSEAILKVLEKRCFNKESLR